MTCRSFIYRLYNNFYITSLTIEVLIKCILTIRHVHVLFLKIDVNQLNMDRF
jgi:hypothetical protein